MTWIQLAVDIQHYQVDCAEATLLAAGAASITLQENILDGGEEQPVLEPAPGEAPLWDYVCLTALFVADCDIGQISRLLGEAIEPLPELHWERLEDKEWEREWMVNYHPIQCAPQFWICPGQVEPPDPEAVNLLLDPGLAFGTGTHPTTFLCLQWLAEQKLRGQHFMDYGCGSGILGIAALLLGADQATGVDIDPQALTATRDNVQRNHLAVERFPVYLPHQLNISVPVDTLMANILAGPLIELAPILIRYLRVKGQLCLSGILAGQADAVMAAYKSHVKCDPVSQKQEWVRISGQRYR